MQHSKCLPLRWETTLEQWWYASPIEWAAANGHYELVRELLLLDNNHLIKLTSLRRLRRLETLWEDDDAGRSREIASCRAVVARELLRECESRRRSCPLARAGYGGWLIYTAASAGDSGFVEELLERDPLIVFGEGEYGVTDILYASAKSKDCNVFRLVFDSVASPSFSTGKDGDLEELKGEITSQYKWEMMNRAVHAAARGGSLRVLKELAEHCSDVTACRDANGSTVLHSAAARGQVEVIEYLLGAFDLVNCIDHQGNTALHIAAYRGQSLALRALVSVSPALISARNNAGETCLHMAVSGFQSPDFQRLDRQIELVNHIFLDKSFRGEEEELINARTSNGRTALHLGLIGKVNSSLSDVLVRQLVSAGGESSADTEHSYSSARSIVSQLKMMQGYGTKIPGTLFTIPDGEILLHAGTHNGLESSSMGPSETEMSLSSLGRTSGSCSSFVRSSSSPARRLKKALWPSMRERKPENVR